VGAGKECPGSVVEFGTECLQDLELVKRVQKLADWLAAESNAEQGRDA
jgi:hypothetical protein